MSYPDLNGFSKDSGGGEAPSSADATLRLIARLPAPEGLEDRVNAGLRAAPRKGRVLVWLGSSPLAGGWLRAAVAAAIVFVVAGGGWGIYSRVQPGQPGRVNGGSHAGAPGGFSEGGAVRRPQTLVGPAVTGPTLPAPAPVVTPKRKMPTKAGAKRTAGSASKDKVSATPAIR
jgi:hypothetical protein